MSFSNNSKPIKLRLENIKKSFGRIVVIDDLSLQVGQNEIVSILGPSGCGKSTLFNIISGIVKPDSGNIFLDDVFMNNKILGKVSYMNQKDLLLPWRSLIDNVSLPYLLEGMSKKEAHAKVLPMLKIFGLEGFENHFPIGLSGGMRQRAALLRTILQNKELVLLDEPFVSLDAITRASIHKWFLDIRKQYNFTALFITHDMNEAAFLSDRVYILSDRPAKIIEQRSSNLVSVK
jgi:ABC-type nitrate/sulfonate/bicarbonate transport system ATPase subunit